MSKPIYIKATEFMEHLRRNNLVIVHEDVLVKNLELKRVELLRKKHLTLTEIVDAKFFHVKDTDTLRRWCLAGKFGVDGYFQDENSRYKIMTAALKKMLSQE